MLIAFPKEDDSESRIALLPETVKKYIKLGMEVGIEQALGEKLTIADQEFVDAGARIFAKPAELLANANVVIKLNKPDKKLLNTLQPDSLYISFLDPFNAPELLELFAQQKVNAISMEMIPRITKAQKMDALSSQANLAGYAAVILAANRSTKAFPMMVTAAGTISPIHVFIIGVGVAGLQAIATAKRLGARVEAFDMRPETADQVQSLGAKFINIDLGSTGKTKDGYAKALSAEQIEYQRQEMTKVCARSDIIITTALVFGKKAPTLITDAMLEQMQPGTIIVDMAAPAGGNVAGCILDEEVVTDKKINIIGYGKLTNFVAYHASQMYANNIYYLIEHSFDKENQAMQLDLHDEIIKGCLLTYNGEVLELNR